jgi:hypothetical protein
MTCTRSTAASRSRCPGGHNASEEGSSDGTYSPWPTPWWPGHVPDSGGSGVGLAAGTTSDCAGPLGGSDGSGGRLDQREGIGHVRPATKTVRAKVSFIHYNSAGTVICKGTWTATGFTSFTGFGTSGQGEEGGVLSIVVTHYCTAMGMIMTAIPMTVTSTVDAPAGSTYVEGATVADFTQPTGRRSRNPA